MSINSSSGSVIIIYLGGRTVTLNKHADMKFEIDENDLFRETINHYDFTDLEIVSELLGLQAAQRLEEKTSDGWRLPSRDELKLVLQSEHQEFREGYYMTAEYKPWENLRVSYPQLQENWCSTEESHWGCCFVRLVRTIESQQQ